MNFPQTNKIKQTQNTEDKFGENVKALDEILNKINWRFFAKVYFSLLGVLLISLFLIIVIVRIAFLIF